ncbi:MAG: S24 family peptidase, partial [Planctomycetota bacterium]|nr:S24 family peptidase [Planctomycetota bacterium]
MPVRENLPGEPVLVCGPEVGTVGASITRLGVPYDEAEIEVKELAGRMVEVLDSSMEPLAWPGQRVLYDPTLPVRPGDLVVVDLGGQALAFKRYERPGREHLFTSLNPT